MCDKACGSCAERARSGFQNAEWVEFFAFNFLRYVIRWMFLATYFPASPGNFSNPVRVADRGLPPTLPEIL